MRISASSSKVFVKIEEELSKIDKEFTNKFASAEYVAEGYITDIKLTTNNEFSDKIVLPINFIITSVKFSDYILMNKNSDGESVEDTKYQIEIDGKIEAQGYKLIYTNLYKVYKEICYR